MKIYILEKYNHDGSDLLIATEELCKVKETMDFYLNISKGLEKINFCLSEWENGGFLALYCRGKAEQFINSFQHFNKPIGG